MSDAKYPLRLRLRAARDLAGLEQTELADLLPDGYERATVSNMETGRKKITGIDLVRWSRATGVPVEFFFFDIGSLVPQEVPGDPYAALDELEDRIASARKQGAV